MLERDVGEGVLDNPVRGTMITLTKVLPRDVGHVGDAAGGTVEECVSPGV